MSIKGVGAAFSRSFETLGRKISDGNAAGKGQKLLQNAGKLIEPAGNAVNPTMFAVALYGCVLVPRAIVAGKRSSTEKREVITRDTIGLTTLVFAMKALNGTIAKAAEKATGLVLTSETKPLKGLNPFQKLFEYLRPSKGVNVLSTDQLTSKLAVSDTKGLAGLVNWLGNNGGDAAKALTSDAKKGGALAGLANQLFEGGIKGKSTSEIVDAINNPKNEEVVGKIVEALKGDSNPLIKKAKFINSGIIKTIGLGVVVAVLGIGLPMFNKYLTKKLDKKKAEGKISHKEWEETTDLIYRLTPEQTKTFQNFLGTK